MKDQPWDLNQTWPIGRKWCRFTNAPKNLGGPFPKLRRKNIKFWTTFSATSAHDTAYLRNETPVDKQNANVSLQCVPYKLTYFPWPMTQKRLRSVFLFWPNIRRPLRCNHQSCDISIYLSACMSPRNWNGCFRLVGWFCSGQFTHISGHPSAVGRA